MSLQNRFLRLKEQQISKHNLPLRRALQIYAEPSASSATPKVPYESRQPLEKVVLRTVSPCFPEEAIGAHGKDAGMPKRR